MTKKQTSIQSFNNHLGKLPPQAPEIERSLIGSIINFGQWKDMVPWLQAEHFYLESHQLIWNAVREVEHITISSVSNYLKKTGKFEQIGGFYFLTRLCENHINPANTEYYARIIQQMWIKREVIRISGDAIKNAYDDSVDCINLFDSLNENLQSVEEIFSPGKVGNKIISGRDNEMVELMIAREGQKFTGLTTGYKQLDEYFRFKSETLNIIVGHDNVGKTFTMLHLAVCANHIHGWRWIFACMENSESRIRQDIIQAKTGKHLSRLSQDEFLSWYNWSLENFVILRISEQITADELLRAAQKVHQNFGAQAFFIDPYNALALPKSKGSFFNSHDYHYEVMGRMRNWVKKNHCSIYLSTHAVTEALRAKHKDGDYMGYPMPPGKADVEGGGKFANRADDFLTIHRYANHPKENNVTHIHVRKVKDNQSGGKQTIVDDPVKLRTAKGYFGLFDEEGNTPLFSTKLENIKPINRNISDYSEPRKDEEPPF